MNRKLKYPRRALLFAGGAMIVWNAGLASADTFASRRPLIGEFMSACKLQGGSIAHATAGARKSPALVCRAHNGQSSVCVYDDESDACDDVGADQRLLSQFRNPDVSLD